MAKDIFNKDRHYTTGNDGDVEKRGASEKRVGPQVPMNEQKPPGVKPQVNPRSRSNNSNTSS